MQLGHDHLCFMQLPGKRLHGFFFAMNQEGACRIAHLPVPGQQFVAVGMGRETADGVDAGTYRDFLAEEFARILAPSMMGRARVPLAA